MPGCERGEPWWRSSRGCPNTRKMVYSLAIEIGKQYIYAHQECMAVCCNYCGGLRILSPIPAQMGAFAHASLTVRSDCKTLAQRATSVAHMQANPPWNVSSCAWRVLRQAESSFRMFFPGERSTPCHRERRKRKATHAQ